MKTTQRVLAILLALGGCGHTAGSLLGYKTQPMVMLWSLTTSEFIFLLAALNYLRAGRPADRPLGWICLIANIAWLIGTFCFGHLIQNQLDPRVLLFAVLTIGLIAGSIGTLRSQRGHSA